MSFLSGAVDTLAGSLPPVTRRGFLGRTVVTATALALEPLTYALEPGDAYGAVCNCHGALCGCGAMCCDGYTEFCCTLTGYNACPTGTVMAGWWKADGTQFCAGPRYYMDCNATCGDCGCGSSGVCPGSCSGTGCGCAEDDCGLRATGCNEFRYGQCNQEIPCLGPIVCRVVACIPPWEIEPTCTTTAQTDESTATHDAPCLHAVVGHLDSATQVAGGIAVSGWAVDFDTPAPIDVQISVAGAQAATLSASSNRPDVGAFLPGYGSDHGFTNVVPVTPDTIEGFAVCATGVNVAFGPGNVLLGCATVAPHDPFGHLDVIAVAPDTLDVRVAGWAIDPDTTDPVTIQVTIDGAVAARIAASVARPDVGALFPTMGPAHGFDAVVPVPRGVHDVCVTALNAGLGEPTRLACATLSCGAPFGNLDSASAEGSVLRVAGWAIDPATPQPIEVLVTVDGVFATRVLADVDRPDVAKAFPAFGPAHGFDVVVATAAGVHDVCVVAVAAGGMPESPIGCAKLDVPTPFPAGGDRG